jgi:succinate dehydrogenase/fumarate reductase flavoprotein subunit
MSATSGYEVAVVGGGLAGLVTALRLAERGVRVVALEKGSDERYPCNARISGGGFHVCFLHVEQDEAALVAAITQATCGFANAELAAVVARDTRTAVRWLKEKGVQFVKGGGDTWRENTLAPPLAARPGLQEGRGGDVLIRTLGTALLGAGGALLRGARARSLRMDGTRCVGVEMEREGNAAIMDARAVVLCDGGFQSNHALLREFITAAPEKLKQRNAGAGNGDALQMARAVGARLVGMHTFYGHLLAREAMHGDALWPYPMVDHLCTAGVVVDGSGRRFADEGLGGVYLVNQLAHLADPLSAIVVYDEAIWNGPGRGHIVPANPHLVEGGAQIFKAGDLRSLAGELGLPAGALEAVIADYNSALAAGRGASLAPPRTTSPIKAHPVSQPPFYAFRLCAGITFTMGGIAVDGVGRVLNEQNEPIAGLYAAGCCTGGLDGGPNAGYVGGLAKSAAMGLRTADQLVASLRRGD